MIVTAIVPGTAAHTIASTTTASAGNNAWDAAVLGTKVTGVDPTAGEGSDALIVAINASATEAISAIDISANEVLILADAVGVVVLGCTETMSLAGNAFDMATMDGGAAGAALVQAQAARVPTAQEVTLGNLHVGLDFTPAWVQVQVRTTATGALVAWDGNVLIEANRLELVNTGGTDWSVAETVYVVAYL